MRIIFTTILEVFRDVNQGEANDRSSRIQLEGSPPVDGLGEPRSDGATAQTLLVAKSATIAAGWGGKEMSFQPKRT